MDQFSDLPPGFLLLIANEFFDALPIHQFERTDQGWRERLIGVKDGQFVLTLSQQAPDLSLPDAPTDTIAETCPQAEKLITAITARIRQSGGAALVIDYGNNKDHFGDSLQAVRGHQFCSALDRPGEADLTAHLRFAPLAEIAQAQGAQVEVIPQADFLQKLGIAARAEALTKKASATDRQDIAAALHRLTAPDQMGALFKVMIIK